MNEIVRANGSDKYSATMRKGDSKMLIRNLRKMKEQEEQKQALDLSNVIHWVENETPPPNKTKQYLVCRNGRVEIHDWFYRDGLGYWWNYLGITHWAELPNPPCV